MSTASGKSQPKPLPPDDDRAWEALRGQWSLRPGVSYLNHGSFGPSPHVVTAARSAWIEQLQSEPMDFLVRQLGPAVESVRQCLGRFIGAAADDLILLDNATTAMNVVAASVPLAAGDEVLTTDHEYGAVLRIWERACARAGARLVVRPLPCPLRSEEETVEALLAGAGDRTRLVVFSHVTSPTAVVLPAEAICRRARRLGIATCVDGPHALAMLPLNLAAMDCDYYLASCHKWLCAPFGSGFLYVHPRAQERVEPVVLSWPTAPGETPSWRSALSWPGTRDPSALLAIPTAVAFLESVGVEAFRARTHYLARRAREAVVARTGLEPLVPDAPRWYGSMISLPLPEGDAMSLQQALWDRYRIEVPIILWQGRRLVRPSCHLYTQPDEIAQLADALAELLGR